MKPSCTEIVVLRRDEDDAFAAAIGAALAERGLRYAFAGLDDDAANEPVVILVADEPPARIMGDVARGAIILPAVGRAGWPEPDDLTDRATQLADAAELLLTFDRPQRRSAPETIAQAMHAVDMMVTGSDETSPLVRICQAFTEAIEWGAPIYNSGDAEACARIYRHAALSIRGYVQAQIERGDGELLDAIADELDRVVEALAALPEADWEERAWTLRHCFDRILIARHTARALYAVDDLFKEIQAAGRALSASLIHDVLRVSMSHGTPIYDAGSPIGCAQVFLCTAAGLLKLLGSEPRVGEGHCEPLARDTLIPLVAGGNRRIENDPKGLVWDLRCAFDALIEAAGSERTWEHDS